LEVRAGQRHHDGLAVRVEHRARRRWQQLQPEFLGCLLLLHWRQRVKDPDEKGVQGGWSTDAGRSGLSAEKKPDDFAIHQNLDE
jgi:hypothetical protein